LLEQISRSASIGAWVLALLGGMLAWVWLARRRPATDSDLFAQHPQPAVLREPHASGLPHPAEEPVPERAPLPSGLPPQFANLDLNLTPAPVSRPAPEADQPAGPKT
jgi:hypothetical protein